MSACLSLLLPSLPSSPLSFLHLLAPFATFHFNSLSHRISLITRVLSAASTLSSSPLSPSGNTFPATPDMSEEDDDVLLGSAIRFQLQLRHFALLLRLLCHLMRRLFLPAVPLPPCLPPLSLCPLFACIVSAFCFVLCLLLRFRFQFQLWLNFVTSTSCFTQPKLPLSSAPQLPP